MSHKKPITRRDFLARGLLGTSGVVLMPSLASMILTRRAFGGTDPCTAPPANFKTPFICVDLAGGANIAGSNVIVGKQGGQLDYLTAYDKLGLPATMHPKLSGQTNTDLGLAFHADSAVLRGIKSVASPTTMAAVDGIVFCTQSNDDTGNNPHNPMYWIAKAGQTGFLMKLIGTESSVSGGNSAAPPESIDPSIHPVQLQQPADARNLITMGQLNLLFTPAKMDSILGAIGNFSAAQLAKFQQADMPTQISTLVGCSYTKARAIAQDNADAYDPRLDAIVGQVFPNLANGGNDPAVATISKLVLDNVAGAGTITLGGYDYHSGNRSDGEGMDFQAGVAIGQCLEMAAKKGKDLMVYVFTDGGISSSGAIDNSTGGRGKGVWSGDSGERAATYALLYRHGNTRPTLRSTTRQVGYFDDAGQAVATQNNLIGQDVDKLSMAVLLNYLALDGSEGEIGSIIGTTDPFNGGAGYLMFTKLG
jgi:hypothetical protein